MKFINKTGDAKEINLIGGSSIIVGPGESMEIDSSKIYDFEISRISGFFEIQKNVNRKVRPESDDRPKGPSKNNGGDV